jgi:hypothetical protein
MRNVFGEVLGAVWRGMGMGRRPRTLPPRVEGDYDTVVAPPTREGEEPALKSDVIAAEIVSRYALCEPMLPPPKKKPLDVDGYVKKVSKKGENTSLRYKPFRRLRRHDE